VSGAVYPVGLQLRSEFGLSFDDEALWDEFEGRLAVVAADVRPLASVSAIDDDREANLGNRVTVLGDITEMLDTRTFRLDAPALLGGDVLPARWAPSTPPNSARRMGTRGMKTC